MQSVGAHLWLPQIRGQRMVRPKLQAASAQRFIWTMAPGCHEGPVADGEGKKFLYLVAGLEPSFSPPLALHHGATKEEKKTHLHVLRMRDACTPSLASPASPASSEDSTPSRATRQSANLSGVAGRDWRPTFYGIQPQAPPAGEKAWRKMLPILPAKDLLQGRITGRR